MPAATLDDLRAAVVADPGDDDARAVLGDALAERGDPRGELYSVQLALARANVRTAAALARSPIATGDPQYAALAALLRRQRDLLAALHGGEPGLYDRGGRAHVMLSYGDDQIEQLAALLASEPVESLAIAGQAITQLAAIARVPGIARIMRVAIRATSTRDLAGLGALLRALPKLTSLQVYGAPFDSALLFEAASLHALEAIALGPYHLDDLAVSPHARTLTRLTIVEPMAGWDPLEALDGRFPRLEHFALSVRTRDTMQIDHVRRRVLPASLSLAIHSDPNATAIAALVERASFAGVRELALPSLPRGSVDVIIATLAGKARELVDVDLSGSNIARGGIAALAQFVPLERLAVSHIGPVTDFAAAVAALRPKALALGDASDPAAIARATTFAGDHVRDLAIRAPLAALASSAIVRLACIQAPADLAALPNLVEVVVPALPTSSDRDLP